MITNVKILLDYLGRHATSALAFGILFGLLAPDLASSLRTLLIPALFIPLTLSLVRIETLQLRRSLNLWRWVAFLCLWILILRPVFLWLTLHIFTLPEPVAKAVLITAAAPPIISCAAIATFLGLDAAIVLVATIATMFLVPLSLPPVVYYLADLQIEAGLALLSLRLASFIFAAFFVAVFIKRWMGQARIDQNREIIDGISVIFIGIFIIGIMHGVTDIVVQHPWYVFQILLVTTFLVLGLYLAATAIFWQLGPRTAMGIGLVSGNCNMGLMYLILVDQANLELLIFFAVGQIPMYFLPVVLAPLISRIRAK